jgi:deazaflavin-dependent oxidoreductase (nitroreductase family)
MGLKDSFGWWLLRTHQSIYESSGGRLGHRLLGMSTLLLRSTGARSGAVRTNALVYAKDRDDYVLVASKGGSDKAPGWLFNVRAQPAVEIQIGRQRTPAVARVLERGEPDYDRLWRLVNDGNHDRYDAYQAKTQRPIALVVATPNR